MNSSFFKLPKKKIKLRKPSQSFLLAGLILLLLTIGGVSAFYLSRINQDVRQQAMEADPYEKPIFQATSTPTPKASVKCYLSNKDQYVSVGTTACGGWKSCVECQEKNGHAAWIEVSRSKCNGDPYCGSNIDCSWAKHGEYACVSSNECVKCVDGEMKKNQTSASCPSPCGNQYQPTPTPLITLSPTPTPATSVKCKTVGASCCNINNSYFFCYGNLKPSKQSSSCTCQPRELEIGGSYTINNSCSDDGDACCQTPDSKSYYCRGGLQMEGSGDSCVCKEADTIAETSASCNSEGAACCRGGDLGVNYYCKQGFTPSKSGPGCICEQKQSIVVLTPTPIGFNDTNYLAEGEKCSFKNKSCAPGLVCENNKGKSGFFASGETCRKAANGGEETALAELGGEEEPLTTEEAKDNNSCSLFNPCSSGEVCVDNQCVTMKYKPGLPCREAFTKECRIGGIFSQTTGIQECVAYLANSKGECRSGYRCGSCEVPEGVPAPTIIPSQEGKCSGQKKICLLSAECCDGLECSWGLCQPTKQACESEYFTRFCTQYEAKICRYTRTNTKGECKEEPVCGECIKNKNRITLDEKIASLADGKACNFDYECESTTCLATPYGKFCGQAGKNCDDGDKKCEWLTNANYEFTCHNGIWIKSSRCGGACAGTSSCEQVCQAPNTKCDSRNSSIVLVCSDDGTGWKREYCGKDEHCENGNCTGSPECGLLTGGAIYKSCPGNDYRCDKGICVFKGTGSGLKCQAELKVQDCDYTVPGARDDQSDLAGKQKCYYSRTDRAGDCTQKYICEACQVENLFEEPTPTVKLEPTPTSPFIFASPTPQPGVILAPRPTPIKKSLDQLSQQEIDLINKYQQTDLDTLRLQCIDETDDFVLCGSPEKLLEFLVPALNQDSIRQITAQKKEIHQEQKEIEQLRMDFIGGKNNIAQIEEKCNQIAQNLESIDLEDCQGEESAKILFGFSDETLSEISVQRNENITVRVLRDDGEWSKNEVLDDLSLSDRRLFGALQSTNNSGLFGNTVENYVNINTDYGNRYDKTDRLLAAAAVTGQGMKYVALGTGMVLSGGTLAGGLAAAGGLTASTGLTALGFASTGMAGSGFFGTSSQAANVCQMARYDSRYQVDCDKLKLQTAISGAGFALAPVSASLQAIGKGAEATLSMKAAINLAGGGNALQAVGLANSTEQIFKTGVTNIGTAAKYFGYGTSVGNTTLAGVNYNQAVGSYGLGSTESLNALGAVAASGLNTFASTAGLGSNANANFTTDLMANLGGTTQDAVSLYNAYISTGDPLMKYEALIALAVGLGQSGVEMSGDRQAIINESKIRAGSLQTPIILADFPIRDGQIAGTPLALASGLDFAQDPLRMASAEISGVEKIGTGVDQNLFRTLDPLDSQDQIRALESVYAQLSDYTARGGAADPEIVRMIELEAQITRNKERIELLEQFLDHSKLSVSADSDITSIRAGLENLRLEDTRARADLLEIQVARQKQLADAQVRINAQEEALRKTANQAEAERLAQMEQGKKVSAAELQKLGLANLAAEQAVADPEIKLVVDQLLEVERQIADIEQQAEGRDGFLAHDLNAQKIKLQAQADEFKAQLAQIDAERQAGQVADDANRRAADDQAPDDKKPSLLGKLLSGVGEKISDAWSNRFGSKKVADGGSQAIGGKQKQSEIQDDTAPKLILLEEDYSADQSKQQNHVAGAQAVAEVLVRVKASGDDASIRIVKPADMVGENGLIKTTEVLVDGTKHYYLAVNEDALKSYFFEASDVVKLDSIRSSLEALVSDLNTSYGYTENNKSRAVGNAIAFSREQVENLAKLEMIDPNMRMILMELGTGTGKTFIYTTALIDRLTGQENTPLLLQYKGRGEMIAALQGLDQGTADGKMVVVRSTNGLKLEEVGPGIYRFNGEAKELRSKSGYYLVTYDADGQQRFQLVDNDQLNLMKPAQEAGKLMIYIDDSSYHFSHIQNDLASQLFVQQRLRANEICDECSSIIGADKNFRTEGAGAKIPIDNITEENAHLYDGIVGKEYRKIRVDEIENNEPLNRYWQQVLVSDRPGDLRNPGDGMPKDLTLVREAQINLLVRFGDSLAADNPLRQQIADFLTDPDPQKMGQPFRNLINQSKDVNLQMRNTVLMERFRVAGDIYNENIRFDSDDRLVLLDKSGKTAQTPSSIARIIELNAGGVEIANAHFVREANINGTSETPRKIVREKGYLGTLEVSAQSREITSFDAVAMKQGWIDSEIAAGRMKPENAPRLIALDATPQKLQQSLASIGDVETIGARIDTKPPREIVAIRSLDKAGEAYSDLRTKPPSNLDDIDKLRDARADADNVLRASMQDLQDGGISEQDTYDLYYLARDKANLKADLIELILSNDQTRLIEQKIQQIDQTVQSRFGDLDIKVIENLESVAVKQRLLTVEERRYSALAVNLLDTGENLDINARHLQDAYVDRHYWEARPKDNIYYGVEVDSEGKVVIGDNGQPIRKIYSSQKIWEADMDRLYFSEDAFFEPGKLLIGIQKQEKAFNWDPPQDIKNRTRWDSVGDETMIADESDQSLGRVRGIAAAERKFGTTDPAELLIKLYDLRLNDPNSSDYIDPHSLEVRRIIVGTDRYYSTDEAVALLNINQLLTKSKLNQDTANARIAAIRKDMIGQVKQLLLSQSGIDSVEIETAIHELNQRLAEISRTDHLNTMMIGDDPGQAEAFTINRFIEAMQQDLPGEVQRLEALQVADGQIKTFEETIKNKLQIALDRYSETQTMLKQQLADNSIGYDDILDRQKTLVSSRVGGSTHDSVKVLVVGTTEAGTESSNRFIFADAIDDFKTRQDVNRSKGIPRTVRTVSNAVVSVGSIVGTDEIVAEFKTRQATNRASSIGGVALWLPKTIANVVAASVDVTLGNKSSKARRAVGAITSAGSTIFGVPKIAAKPIVERLAKTKFGESVTEFGSQVAEQGLGSALKNSLGKLARGNKPSGEEMAEANTKPAVIIDIAKIAAQTTKTVNIGIGGSKELLVGEIVAEQDDDQTTTPIQNPVARIEIKDDNSSYLILADDVPEGTEIKVNGQILGANQAAQLRVRDVIEITAKKAIATDDFASQDTKTTPVQRLRVISRNNQLALVSANQEDRWGNFLNGFFGKKVATLDIQSLDSQSKASLSRWQQATEIAKSVWQTVGVFSKDKALPIAKGAWQSVGRPMEILEKVAVIAKRLAPENIGKGSKFSLTSALDGVMDFFKSPVSSEILVKAIEHLVLDGDFGGIYDSDYEKRRLIDRIGHSSQDFILNTEGKSSKVYFSKNNRVVIKFGNGDRLKLEIEFLAVAQQVAPGLFPAIYRVIQDDNGKILAYEMEYIEGVSLIEAFNENPNTVSEHAIKDAARQLKLLNDLGYVHGDLGLDIDGDLRSANIRITPDGKIRLIDPRKGKSSSAKIAVVEKNGQLRTEEESVEFKNRLLEVRNDFIKQKNKIFHQTVSDPWQAVKTKILEDGLQLQGDGDQKQILDNIFAEVQRRGLVPQNDYPSSWYVFFNDTYKALIEAQKDGSQSNAVWKLVFEQGYFYANGYLNNRWKQDNPYIVKQSVNGEPVGLAYKLHISPSSEFFDDVVLAMAEFLNNLDIKHKIAAGDNISRIETNEGRLKFGKVITIYPSSKDQFDKIVAKVKELSYSYQGVDRQEDSELAYELEVPDTNGLLYYTINGYQTEFGNFVNLSASGELKVGDQSYAGYQDRLRLLVDASGNGPLDYLFNFDELSDFIQSSSPQHQAPQPQSAPQSAPVVSSPALDQLNSDELKRATGDLLKSADAQKQKALQEFWTEVKACSSYAQLDAVFLKILSTKDSLQTVIATGWPDLEDLHSQMKQSFGSASSVDIQNEVLREAVDKTLTNIKTNSVTNAQVLLSNTISKFNLTGLASVTNYIQTVDAARDVLALIKELNKGELGLDKFVDNLSNILGYKVELDYNKLKQLANQQTNSSNKWSQLQEAVIQSTRGSTNFSINTTDEGERKFAITGFINNLVEIANASQHNLDYLTDRLKLAPNNRSLKEAITLAVLTDASDLTNLVSRVKIISDSWGYIYINGKSLTFNQFVKQINMISKSNNFSSALNASDIVKINGMEQMLKDNKEGHQPEVKPPADDVSDNASQDLIAASGTPTVSLFEQFIDQSFSVGESNFKVGHKQFSLADIIKDKESFAEFINLFKNSGYIEITTSYYEQDGSVSFTTNDVSSEQLGIADKDMQDLIDSYQKISQFIIKTWSNFEQQKAKKLAHSLGGKAITLKNADIQTGIHSLIIFNNHVQVKDSVRVYRGIQSSAPDLILNQKAGLFRLIKDERGKIVHSYHQTQDFITDQEFLNLAYQFAKYPNAYTVEKLLLRAKKINSTSSIDISSTINLLGFALDSLKESGDMSMSDAMQWLHLDLHTGVAGVSPWISVSTKIGETIKYISNNRGGVIIADVPRDATKILLGQGTEATVNLSLDKQYIRAFLPALKSGTNHIPAVEQEISEIIGKPNDIQVPAHTILHEELTSEQDMLNKKKLREASRDSSDIMLIALADFNVTVDEYLKKYRFIDPLRYPQEFKQLVRQQKLAEGLNQKFTHKIDSFKASVRMQTDSNQEAEKIYNAGKNPYKNNLLIEISNNSLLHSMTVRFSDVRDYRGDANKNKLFTDQEIAMMGSNQNAEGLIPILLVLINPRMTDDNQLSDFSDLINEINEVFYDSGWGGTLFNSSTDTYSFAALQKAGCSILSNATNKKLLDQGKYPRRMIKFFSDEANIGDKQIAAEINTAEIKLAELLEEAYLYKVSRENLGEDLSTDHLVTEIAKAKLQQEKEKSYINQIIFHLSGLTDKAPLINQWIELIDSYQTAQRIAPHIQSFAAGHIGLDDLQDRMSYILQSLLPAPNFILDEEQSYLIYGQDVHDFRHAQELAKQETDRSLIKDLPPAVDGKTTTLATIAKLLPAPIQLWSEGPEGLAEQQLADKLAKVAQQTLVDALKIIPAVSGTVKAVGTITQAADLLTTHQEAQKQPTLPQTIQDLAEQLEEQVHGQPAEQASTQLSSVLEQVTKEEGNHTGFNLKQHLQSLQEEYNDQLQRLKNQQAEFKEGQNKLAAQIKERDKTKNEILRLQEDIDQLKRDAKSLLDQLKLSRKDYKEIFRQLFILRDQLNELTPRLSLLQQRLDKVNLPAEQAQASELKQDLNNLEENFEGLRSYIAGNKSRLFFEDIQAITNIFDYETIISSTRMDYENFSELEHKFRQLKALSEYDDFHDDGFHTKLVEFIEFSSNIRSLHSEGNRQLKYKIESLQESLVFFNHGFLDRFDQFYQSTMILANRNEDNFFELMHSLYRDQATLEELNFHLSNLEEEHLSILAKVQQELPLGTPFSRYSLVVNTPQIFGQEISVYNKLNKGNLVLSFNLIAESWETMLSQVEQRGASSGTIDYISAAIDAEHNIIASEALVIDYQGIKIKIATSQKDSHQIKTAKGLVHFELPKELAMSVTEQELALIIIDVLHVIFGMPQDVLKNPAEKTLQQAAQTSYQYWRDEATSVLLEDQQAKLKMDHAYAAYQAPVLVDEHLAIKAETDKRFVAYNQLTTANPVASLISILQNGGLMSTEERFERGVHDKEGQLLAGWGSQKDLETGGALGVFTRTYVEDAQISENLVLKPEAIYVVFDPALYDRVDMWAYPDDKAGTREEAIYKKRQKSSRQVVEDQLANGFDAHNEQMWYRGIGTKYIKKIVCSTSEQRNQILKALKAAVDPITGKKASITYVNGIKVEDLLVVKGNIAEFIDLAWEGKENEFVDKPIELINYFDPILYKNYQFMAFQSIKIGCIRCYI